MGTEDMKARHGEEEMTVEVKLGYMVMVLEQIEGANYWKPVKWFIKLEEARSFCFECGSTRACVVAIGFRAGGPQFKKVGDYTAKFEHYQMARPSKREESGDEVE